MKATFRMKDDWKLACNTFIPFHLLKEEWNKQIGQKTADGDLILEVKDISDNEIEIVIEVLSPITRKRMGGEKVITVT